jgi:hypothetical protein
MKLPPNGLSLATFAIAAVGAMGCSSTSSAGDAPVSDAGAALSPDGATAEDIVPTAADFDCIHGSAWTTVGISQYKNLLGHTDEMLAVARADAGGTFPPGTIVQLVPTEASVKRGAGYSADSHDWEFFSLSVSSTGTTIGAHGGDAGVLNAFGLSCLNCHAKAAPQWDLICGNNVDGGSSHGCDPLPLPGSTLAALSDPRCP